jgi:hypothetical protein
VMAAPTRPFQLERLEDALDRGDGELQAAE